MQGEVLAMSDAPGIGSEKLEIVLSERWQEEIIPFMGELIDLYVGIVGILGEGKIPDDLEIVGENEDGFPILKSDSRKFSIEFVFINFGRDDENS